jgi:polyphosphate kinase 2
MDKMSKLSKKEFEEKALKEARQIEELKLYQAELIKLQKHLEKVDKSMIILFEGRDAAGKGGAIKRISEHQNNKHTRVVALGTPSDHDKKRGYFWRFTPHFPASGEIVLFDRSWYSRALVEPVFGFCTEEQYTHFMKQVPKFEKMLIEDGSTILIKLYFSVSKEEQAARFEKRKTNSLKQWKLSEIDLQAQELWDEFTKVKYKMLKKTNTTLTPWHIIRADDKHLARLNAMKLILNSVDYEGRNQKLDFKLDMDICVSGSREIELMEADGPIDGIFPH